MPTGVRTDFPVWCVDAIDPVIRDRVAHSVAGWQPPAGRVVAAVLGREDGSPPRIRVWVYLDLPDGRGQMQATMRLAEAFARRAPADVVRDWIATELGLIARMGLGQ